MPDGYASKVSSDDISLYAQQPYEELKKEGFQPRGDVEPWPFEIPVNWSADPFDDRNWRFQLHAWRGIDPILKKYFETEDTQYLQEAIGFVDDWHEYHEENDSTKFTWYDMAAGLRAMRLALYLDAVYSGAIEVTDETANMLVAVADEHARRLQDEEFINLGNHGLFQVFGLDLLCSVISNRSSCEGGRDFAASMFEKILDHGYTEQGVHKEHSPYYHYFTTATINRFDPSKLGSKKAETLMKKAGDVQPWLVWPDGRFVEVGDSEGTNKPLAGDVDLTCLEEDRCFAVSDFTESGYAIVRSDPNASSQPSMLFVMGMAYSKAHKHGDELSFALFEHGEPVFIDSGKYGYNYNKWRDYVESAAAHNTISLLDKEIGRSDAPMAGSFLNTIETGSHKFLISGSTPRPDLFTQQRTFQYDPGRSLVIRDELTSEAERKYVSSLHLARHLHPKLVADGFDVRLNGGEIVRARLEDEDCEITMTRGQENPVLGWQSVGYLEMEPTTVVRATCPGKNRSITWNVHLQ